jgi:putative restriction endonuclease
VFSFADAVVGAVGMVLGRARETPEPRAPGATQSKRKRNPGWQVPVRFVELERPLRTMEHATVLASVLPKKNSPLRASGIGVRGIYLSAVPEAMVILLRRLLDGQVEGIEEKIRSAVGSELLDERTEETIRQRTDIGPVEKERLIRARYGQGPYRRHLEEIESGCRLTGLLDRRHLRASHIKPWRESDDREKLDGFNGLLFSPHIGHLFDRGYVSFSDAGELLVSRHLNPRVLNVWHIALPTKVEAFKPEQCAYLDYHRREVFERHDRGRRSQGTSG